MSDDLAAVGAAEAFFGALPVSATLWESTTPFASGKDAVLRFTSFLQSEPGKEMTFSMGGPIVMCLHKEGGSERSDFVAKTSIRTKKAHIRVHETFDAMLMWKGRQVRTVDGVDVTDVDGRGLIARGIMPLDDMMSCVRNGSLIKRGHKELCWYGIAIANKLTTFCWLEMARRLVRNPDWDGSTRDAKDAIPVVRALAQLIILGREKLVPPRVWAGFFTGLTCGFVDDRKNACKAVQAVFRLYDSHSTLTVEDILKDALIPSAAPASLGASAASPASAAASSSA